MAQEELLARLRRVEATDPADWGGVLRIVMLLRALDSTHAALRQRAVLSAESTEPMPADVLTEAVLAETDPNVAGAMRWALARSGSDALAAAGDGLSSMRPEVRQRAVAVIAAVQGEEATALLQGALADLDDLVRRRAALALGSRGQIKVAPALIEMVVEGESDVEAAEILGRLAQDAGTAKEIVEAMVGRAGDTNEAQVRRLAQALAEIPGTAARRALSNLAHDDDHTVSLTARSILEHRDAQDALE